MAVNNRTECFFKSLYQIQGILLFLVLCGAGIALANPRGCDLVKNDVQSKGFLPSHVLERPAIGAICGADSCCNRELENDMLKFIQLYVDKYLRDSVLKLSSLIDTRAKKFDEFFLDMMKTSKLEFHEMFKKTYGKIYMENSDVFNDFFIELETYYKKGTVRLSDTMDTFFGILYQRMFTVINAQYTFDEKYLECVTDQMADLKPFGDVPKKLGVQLRRSFVATRTFYKSLQVGANIASSMIDLKMDEECLQEMTRMQFCGICKGEQGAGACSSYCSATLETCFRHHAQFNSAWDSYVDAIDKVADRLLGPYNVEAVVEPINIKISEAIMNFQESGKEVSQKIYNLCGKPTLFRPKRKAEYSTPQEDHNIELDQYAPIKISGRKKHKKVEKVDTTPTLEKLIGEIKTKIKDTMQFWVQLPYQYCNNQTIFASPSQSSECWNGTSMGLFDQPKLAKHVSTQESPIISQHMYTIKIVTEKLRKAYHGQEVEILDEEEPDEGSGSGSGDGGIEFTTEDKDTSREAVEETSTSSSTTSTSTTSEEPEHTSGASPTNNLCLTSALVQYILPIVLAWFGGAISDLL